MKCTDVRERLSGYIGKSLRPAETRRVTEHLMRCSECERAYRAYEHTHELLGRFGEAVRSGRTSMSAPPMPAQEPSASDRQGLRWLSMPVPIWMPASAAAILLVAVVSVTAPSGPVTIQWGAEKGGAARGITTPPLAAEAMLEFLIVPDPTDPGQLAASVSAVETFLASHPDDLAMRAKLVELYQYQLQLPYISDMASEDVVGKLDEAQARLQDLLQSTRRTDGA